MGYEGNKKRAYQLQWIKARRVEWISANGPCVECGSWENLEVDHSDRTTKRLPSAGIWSRRKEVRDIELAKCVVRCRSCHREKSSSERRAVGKPCPSSNAYRLGCRCADCREINRLRVRRYRENLRLMKGPGT